MQPQRNKRTIKIELTPEQKEQIKQASGKEVAALELKPETLEDRTAPGIWSN